MLQADNSHKIERTCSICGHHDEIMVSKRDAAFELVDINDLCGSTCKKCSSTSFNIAFQIPELDFDLLLEWATDPNLFLMQQDEELLLADEKYLENILHILDTVPIPDHKRDALMDALCIIVYDNTGQDNSGHANQLKNRVIEELNKRLDKLMLADRWIMDYIKEVVYPQLSFNK